MKIGKSVGHGSKGASMSEILVGGLAQASKELVIGKDVSSSGLAPNVVGASPEPFKGVRGMRPNPTLGLDWSPSRSRRRPHQTK